MALEGRTRRRTWPGVTGLKISISEKQKMQKNHSTVPNADAAEITGTEAAFEEWERFDGDPPPDLVERNAIS